MLLEIEKKHTKHKYSQFQTYNQNKKMARDTVSSKYPEKLKTKKVKSTKASSSSSKTAPAVAENPVAVRHRKLLHPKNEGFSINSVYKLARSAGCVAVKKDCIMHAKKDGENFIRKVVRRAVILKGSSVKLTIRHVLAAFKNLNVNIFGFNSDKPKDPCNVVRRTLKQLKPSSTQRKALTEGEEPKQ